MNDTTIGLDQTEEEILTYEVSDEALDRGGHGEGKSGTLYAWVLHWFICLPRLTSLLDWSWLLDFFAGRRTDEVLDEAPTATAPRYLFSFGFFPCLPTRRWSLRRARYRQSNKKNRQNM